MKRFFLTITLASLTATLFPACQSIEGDNNHGGSLGLNSRLTRNASSVEKLSSAQKKQVKQGRIANGMTKEAVRVAWGKPDRVKNLSSGGKKIERWYYMGSEGVYESGQIGFSHLAGMGPRGVNGPYRLPFDSSGNDTRGNNFAREYVSRSVDFRSGKVISWTHPRR